MAMGTYAFGQEHARWTGEHVHTPSSANVTAAARPGSAAAGRAVNGTVSFRGVFVLGAEHVVGPLLVADHVIGVVGRGVLRRIVRPDAGRHRGHRPVDIAVAEKRQGRSARRPSG